MSTPNSDTEKPLGLVTLGEPMSPLEPEEATKLLDTLRSLVEKIPKFIERPSDDGVTHINVYSKGRTELGRELSNFSRNPFHLEDHGHFTSVEAYWYWLKTGKQHDNLRRLYGQSAKLAGKKLLEVEWDETEFQDCIRRAIKQKILDNPRLQKNFVESELPFAHYYVYGSGHDVIRRVPDQDWQVEYLTELRKELKAIESETV